MTKYQIFLLSIATISWVFLSGLNMAVDNDKLVLENQKTSKAAEADVADNNNPLNVTSLKSRWIFLFPIKILKMPIGLWSKDRPHKAGRQLFLPRKPKKRLAQ